MVPSFRSGRKSAHPADLHPFHRQASMTELYPTTPTALSRRTTLRAAGGGTLLL
ncbi:hypothetical protein GT043_20320, partial [Streptomyces sp. SID2131]|nr:hypothetical protein [Streptomyces sp. SID2131]